MAISETMLTSVTGGILDVVSCTRLDEVDAGVLETCTRYWIDCLAASFAGVASPVAQTVRGFVQECGGATEATIIGAQRQAPSVHAALANGVAAHAIDYDDTSWSLFGHPTAVVLPVVLALSERIEGERVGATGAQALAAYAIGVEVSCKLGRLLCPPHYERGWHATSTMGVFGATCAAAILLGLDRRRLGHALGLAAAQSGGLTRNFGSMAKPFQVGQAARNAVTAALLAAQGVTAGAEIFDGAAGYLEVYAGAAHANAHANQLVASFGQPYDLVDPGFAIKMYPTCAFTHCAIDATLELVREHGITPDEVANVTCQVNALAPTILIHHNPATALEAKFSMEFCLAAALCFAEVGPKQVTDEVLRQAQLRDMMRRIRMTPSEELAGDEAARLSPAIVTITLRNGRASSTRILAPRGSGPNPVSAADLEMKFRQCAALHLPAAEVERCLSLLKDLKQLESLTPLTARLRFLPAS